MDGQNIIRVANVKYFVEIPPSKSVLKELGGPIMWRQAPEFIEEADHDLGLAGELCSYAAKHPPNFGTIDRLTGEEWYSFFSGQINTGLWRTYSKTGQSGMRYTVLIEYCDRSDKVLATEESRKAILNEHTRRFTKYMLDNPSATTEQIAKYALEVAPEELMFKYGIPPEKMGFFFDHIKKLSTFDKRKEG